MDGLEGSSSGNNWESSGVKSFVSTINEDAEGNLLIANEDREKSRRARLKRTSQAVRRGLIRYLLVAVDCSSAAAEKDFSPSRLAVCRGAVSKFVLEFYDQNPISSLALLVTRDRIAEQISDLSGNSKTHQEPLSALGVPDNKSETKLRGCSGAASLQNTLICALVALKHVPDYGYRELLIVYSSLSSCDPGDVLDTIQECKKNKLRVSVICVAAEVRICKMVTEETGGSFAVAMNAEHLSELLMEQCVPPAELQSHAPLTTEFVYMGFPELAFSSFYEYAHEGKQATLSRINYKCPRCFTKATDLPTQCQVCCLQLNSSARIARSHHHLFPVAAFVETCASESAPSRCKGCLKRFQSDSLRMSCPMCQHIFCVNCDIFIHDKLHNCPGCGGAPQPTPN